MRKLSIAFAIVLALLLTSCAFSQTESTNIVTVENGGKTYTVDKAAWAFSCS